MNSRIHQKPPDQEVQSGSTKFYTLRFFFQLSRKIWQRETWFLSNFHSGHRRTCTLADSEDSDEMPQIPHLFRVYFAY